jgi:hypothetical protein
MFFKAVVLLGLFFDHEDGGNVFLRNISRLSVDYIALCLRKQNSSSQPVSEGGIAGVWSLLEGSSGDVNVTWFFPSIRWKLTQL